MSYGYYIGPCNECTGCMRCYDRWMEEEEREEDDDEDD